MTLDDHIDLIVSQIEILADKFFISAYPDNPEGRIFSMAMMIHEEVFNKMLNLEERHKWLKKN